MAKIPTILEPGRADGKLVTSGAIFDENKSMFQSELNDVQDTLSSDNPNKPLSAKQGKVLKELLDTKVIEAGAVPIDTNPIEGNITHVVSSDGLAKEFNKCSTEIIQGGVYDVSAHNNSKVFESLYSLLNNSNLDTLIPISVRHGGMSICFVQSSNNKYVQYRLMSDTWSKTPSDWQGVDGIPTARSQSLVTGGGVFDFVGQHKNAILEIIDADPSSLSVIPYGVVEIGVHDTFSSTSAIYLKRCHYRSESGFFYITLTDSDGSNILNAYYDVSSQNGLVKLSTGSFGYFELIIDCDWLKSNPISSMDLGLTAPVSLEKLKSTTYSQLLYEKDKLNINCGYRICNTTSAVQTKEVPVNIINKMLVVGQVGKVKMIHSNSFVPTDTENVKMRMGETEKYDLYYNGKPVSNVNTWNDGDVLDCYFDGERYYLTPLADNSTFVGTDGSDSGKKGLVPAPTSEQQDYILSSDGSWKRNDGYIIKTEVSVNTNSQRTQNYNIKPGTRIAVRVSKVSGTGSTYTLYWIKPDGNQNIFAGYPLGYMSDELVVPDDATGISIFMTPAGSDNVNLIEVFDPSNTLYIEKKLNYNIDGIEYLNNRQVVNIHTTLEVTSSLVNIFSINDGRLKNLKGDMYAFVESLAEFNNKGHIRFYFDDNSVALITGLQLRQSKLFKLGNNKVLNKISVWQNSVVTAGDIYISVFAIEPPQTYLQYPLYKKNIMCFGDSLTEFKSSDDNKRYSDHLQDISQANVYNAGIGGTRLALRTTLSLTPSDQQQCIAAFDIAALIQAWSTKDFNYQDAAIASGYLGSSYQTKFENKLAVLKNNPIENFDIVTIFGGHNDYNGGSVIGTKEYNNYDIYTVCGAVNNSIKSINTANPKIQIYMYGLIPLTYNDGGTNIYSDDYIPENAPSYNGHQLKAYEFSDIIHDVAKLNHTPFDDLYWDCGLNRYNHNEYYPVQGDTHPYYGFEYIAKKIYKFLLSK